MNGLETVFIDIFYNADFSNLFNHLNSSYTGDLMHGGGCGYIIADEVETINQMPMPGVKCPSCLERGITQ